MTSRTGATILVARGRAGGELHALSDEVARQPSAHANALRRTSYSTPLVPDPGGGRRNEVQRN